MIDPVIEDFFIERKESWLKKNITSSLTEIQIEEKKRECEEIFFLENWLPKAAKRAGQMSITTHPGKFSHPSAQITPIISRSVGNFDGYLRSGNVEVERDALGNAAAIDVYKFLTLTMNDSKKLIDHIQEDSKLAVSLLTIKSADYETLKNDFLAMIKPVTKQIMTSSKIKQVYFPVINGYHQLSILINSGIVFELKKRIDTIRFSDEMKELRDKKKNNIYSEQGYLELYDLTVIGYGGTKPQNISILNSHNGGKSYLLSSLPPTFKKRDIHFPKYNFFRESLKESEYRLTFHALQKLFKTDYNNMNIREGRDWRLQNLVDLIIHRMAAVRDISKEQYIPDTSHLKQHQKIWLCPEEYQKRQVEDAWLDVLCEEIARWIVITYERLTHRAEKLGEAERKHIEDIVMQSRGEFR